MTGRRLPDGYNGPWAPGDYAKINESTWYGQPPSGGLGNLVNHQVAEHEDGTITVSPSILVYATPTNPEWHGYLERGVWRQV